MITGNMNILIKTGLVTIAGHLNDDIAKGTLNSILRLAGLKERGRDA